MTFASHSEAQAAYRSTEAVLNNRFIKVFWHNKEPAGANEKQQGENVPPSAKGLSVKERLGGGGQRVLGQSQTTTVLDEVAMKEATEAKEKEREKVVSAIKRSQKILATKEALKRNKKSRNEKLPNCKLFSSCSLFFFFPHFLLLLSFF